MATGYVRQLGEGTRPIDVAPGQAVRGVRLAMQPTGTVSGRIRDLDGRPVAGVSVQILRRSYDLLGDRTFQSAGSAVSDDRGEYRVSAVTPGRYYMLAGPQMASPLLRAASPNAPRGFSVLPTFYPNAAELDAAMAIDVVSGTERSDIDFLVERQPLRRITGRVLEAATGAPPQAVEISVVTLDAPTRQCHHVRLRPGVLCTVARDIPWHVSLGPSFRNSAIPCGFESLG